MPKIQSVRGTHDLVGSDLLLYKKIEKNISKLAEIYDFDEIQTPIIENSDLFKKPLGEHSDVVLKEMYSFEDRSNSFLTLRPEYTVPMIRASLNNNLLKNLPVKLFGMGPMFRRERPQKGRYRQFNQINFEILGVEECSSDAELIMLANNFLKELKIDQKVKLKINSLGDINTISKYKSILSEYYTKYQKDLSDESKAKLHSNSLRILDSKDEKDIKINKNAPVINDYYSKKANQNFDQIQKIINKAGINFEVDNNLVRGLDYYCHTVFEFKTNELGSQDTIIGGGRYDGLIKILGGPDIPGVGWASGVERIMMMLDKINKITPVVQVITIDNSSIDYAMKLTQSLRNNRVKTAYDHKINIKKSLKKANESKIKFAIIVGENEVKNNNYTIKNLNEGTQQVITFDELLKIINL
tara:strand:- start:6569 stop:7807 length:1239 start_codon:yes stop_codon:yes gene_type:complete